MVLPRHKIFHNILFLLVFTKFITCNLICDSVSPVYGNLTSSVAIKAAEKIIFICNVLSGTEPKLQFDKEDTSIDWVGMVFKNGGCSWFLIETSKERHYFTSETGTFIFGSKFSAS